jgi:dTMP kinase
MSQQAEGQFIVVEGGEGSGKTTNLSFICDYLKQRHISFIQTREPGGTPLAEEIRELLLQKRDEVVASDAELLLMFAARAQHLERVIKPALQRGQWVVCDRFTDATYAYQGSGRQLGFDKINRLEQLVQGNLRPDKVILLDVPLEVGMARARARGELDRMESEHQDFFRRVRDGYLQRVAGNPKGYLVVDASQSLAQVQADLAAQLDQWLADIEGAADI